MWKVGGAGGKVFAIAWFARGKHPSVTFKVSAIGWEILREAPGCRPAPYFASLGMKWIQSHEQSGHNQSGHNQSGHNQSGHNQSGRDGPGLSKRELKAYLRASHALAAEGLTRKVRKELHL